ncbi:fatty acyl-AMP ligase [Amycolatopsis sp. TRM77291]
MTDAISVPDTSPARTVVDLLRYWAEEDGDRLAVAFVDDPELPEPAVSLSYRELDRAARRTAVLLGARVRPGERVLVVSQDGPDFLTAFLGCLYAGAVAVPAPAPGGNRYQAERLARILSDAEPSAMLGTTRLLPGMRELTTSPCLVTDGPEEADAGSWRRPRIDGGTTAMIQYTSGSTRDPVGVLLSHANIVANAEALLADLGPGSTGRFGGWTPLYHDMGLAIALQPLLFGGTSVLMAPMTFLKRPYTWLRLIDRYRLEMSAGPDFAYRMCTAKITDEQIDGLDLSSWRWALNGAEPVNPVTLRAFAARFGRAGLGDGTLTPVYGLAEATVYVSGAGGNPPVFRTVDARSLEAGKFVLTDDPAEGYELACCGWPKAFDLRIADHATGLPLEAGRVGEIQLRGASVGAGYWRAGPNRTEDGYLRTGDLGVRHEGELYVLGRTVDALDDGDRVLLPQRLETEIRAELGAQVETGVAVQGDGTEIVIIQEVRGRPDQAELRAIVTAVRRRLWLALTVQPARVVLVRRGAILRTTSNKIRRGATRELYRAGRLDPLYSDRRPLPALALV